MKIIDCFIFYNELDLLNYRLNILAPYVDYFVIVEATHTFTGKEKPLIYNDNKHLFQKFANKIIHFVVDDMPFIYPNIDFEKKEQWTNEYHQRNRIDKAIKTINLQDDDILLITDLDEIPDPRVINEIRNAANIHTILQAEVISLRMDLYYNNLTLKSKEYWTHPKMISYNVYKNISSTMSCNDIRTIGEIFSIENAGWHLSYFGDCNFIKNKLNNFSHQEYNKELFTSEENIIKSIDEGRDLFNRESECFLQIPINKNTNLPFEYDKYLQKYYKKNVVFFVRHFTERGTEVATFDYARYNEEILGNKSFIVCFTDRKQRSINYPHEKYSYDKFKSRFTILEIDDISQMADIILNYNINFFYTLSSGEDTNICDLDNKSIWGNCKTIKHCVFDTRFQESDFYISISPFLNNLCNTNIPVIPHIVDLPDINEDLRDNLNIPKDAIVFGRYGGEEKFNIEFVHDAIKEFLQINTNIYFLFMNTNKFYEHPNIIYLEKNVDLNFKTMFINTCDAMLHARDDGESFGLSIGEFSIRNKPIITCKVGFLEHIQILGKKAIIYESVDDLMYIFKNIRRIIKMETDWNMYRDYSPKKVMAIFDEMIFSK